MTDSPDGGIDRYTQLLLESIAKLSGQTEELNRRYAALLRNRLTFWSSDPSRRNF